jgi:hypothetical protein
MKFSKSGKSGTKRSSTKLGNRIDGSTQTCSIGSTEDLS